jgi:hypothetical protein
LNQHQLAGHKYLLETQICVNRLTTFAFESCVAVKITKFGFGTKDMYQDLARKWVGIDLFI